MSNDKAPGARQLTLGLAEKGADLIPAIATEELTDALQEILFLAAMAIVKEAAPQEVDDED